MENSKLAEAKFKLAQVWQAKGKLKLAIANYQQALDLQPDYFPAHLYLGNLFLSIEETQQALDHYEKAVYLKANRPHWDAYYQSLNLAKPSGEEEKPAIDLVENPLGKINLQGQITFGFHRSGWNFAVDALRPLHNSQGVLFDGFVENNFAWKHREPRRSNEVLEQMKRCGLFNQLANTEEQGITPYTVPWVGFLHNPQAMPNWFYFSSSPQSILLKEIWQKSCETCLGLFTLSEYTAQWLREQTGKPVSSLIHPTEIPKQQFEFHKFLDNPNKRIIQIGWWLRRLSAIYRLPVAKDNALKYKKTRLLPKFSHDSNLILQGLIEKEQSIDALPIESAFIENTQEIQHVSNSEYDLLLSENIAFLELYDSNANNAIIECIARATPLLVNPLPAVIEYLGKDYPMYFNDVEEAAKKALDTTLILETHLYLREWEIRKQLSADYFLKSFQDSEVYQSIQ